MHFVRKVPPPNTMGGPITVSIEDLLVELANEKSYETAFPVC
jgi:hypothetical protein